MAILIIFNFSLWEFFNIVQANERVEVKIYVFHIRYLVWYAVSPRSITYGVLIIHNTGVPHWYKKDKTKKPKVVPAPHQLKGSCDKYKLLYFRLPKVIQ